ncbi:hypothetical protein D9615_005986 [Tricholomella constricta]|uniref:Uncharacterized protein n=1 Tax=Tricholomella constricta TaxID=117010 RepID=A0A8H5H9Z9_9AGAR|nr:hypothetical protein D9615_005986 [Tricholomella constricta]
MSTIIVEQRLPIIIQFISLIPAYTQYITVSVTAIFIFWLCPSLAPQMPIPHLPMTMHRKCRETSGGTLPSPMKMGKSPTLSLRPFARRMSMPARRLSEHITTALASPFQTPHTLDLEEVDSYFAPQGQGRRHCISVIEVKEPEVKEAALVEAEVVKVERVDRVARVECWVAEQEACVVEAPIVAPTTPAASLKETTRFKRVTKKAKALLRVRRPTL